MSDDQSSVIEMAAEIVSAYVGHNVISTEQLPNLIRQVHAALNSVGTGAPEAPPAALVPAVSIKKSINPDFLICLEDGRRFKSLKRHLRTRYAMSPEEYRAKWGLPKTYPMVAPSYAAARSALAKSMGLGQAGRKAAKPEKAPRRKKAQV